MITRRSLVLLGLAGPLLSLSVRRSAAGPPALKWERFYYRGDYSEQAGLFNGTTVTMNGFMAPALKVDAKFFVLTPTAVGFCPFCGAVEDWPDNIILVYAKGGTIGTNNEGLLTVTGRLELGEMTDPDTGYVSMVRLMDAAYARVKG